MGPREDADGRRAGQHEPGSAVNPGRRDGRAARTADLSLRPNDVPLQLRHRRQLLPDSVGAALQFLVFFMLVRPAHRPLVVAAFILLGLCKVVSRATAQSSGRPMRVLVLFQQQAESQPMVEFTDRLRATVRDEVATPIEFYQEALDLDRFHGRENSPALVQYFADKYRRV